jgi:hypothetical protein
MWELVISFRASFGRVSVLGAPLKPFFGLSGSFRFDKPDSVLATGYRLLILFPILGILGDLRSPPDHFSVAFSSFLCLPSNLRLLSSHKKKESVMNVARPHPIIRICKHVLGSGSRCQGAAAAGRPYCRHHLESRIRLRRMARMRRRYSPLPPIFLADDAGIRHAAVHIDAGLSNGRIDPADGRVLLWALQMAQSVNRTIARYGLPPSSAIDQRQVASRGKPKHFYHLSINPLNRRT